MSDTAVALRVLLNEANAENTRLRARVAELEAALRPFAESPDVSWRSILDGSCDIGRINYDTRITLADIDRARADLAKKDPTL